MNSESDSETNGGLRSDGWFNSFDAHSGNGLDKKFGSSRVDTGHVFLGRSLQVDQILSSSGLGQTSIRPVAIFDATHGQPDWVQTGFSSCEMHMNFAGVTEELCRLGFDCRPTEHLPLPDYLPGTRLLIIPPPTGRYDASRERWKAEKDHWFTPQEIREVLRFVHEGGSLMAFSYRFGDSFTQTNLKELITPLGCQLNDDAVLDAAKVKSTHPLELLFETDQEALPLSWSRIGVSSVQWRPCATFNILPGAHAWPLAVSSGGGCLSFNRTLRRIDFASLPVAVVGIHGRGRFALFGGPHLFETDRFGLLEAANNRAFLNRVVEWLVPDRVGAGLGCADPRVWTVEREAQKLARVECDELGERTIQSVERLLRRTGVLRALGRARWMP